MIKSRFYFGIGTSLILLAILILMWSNFIIPLSPRDNAVLTERQPTFKWIGNADRLVIDDNEQFISPIIEKANGHSHQARNELNFTTYYWKLVGDKESSVRKFSIDSIVALRLKSNSRLGNLTNIGTTDLDVEVQETIGASSKITGEAVLQRNQSKSFEIKNSTIFVGKQR